LTCFRSFHAALGSLPGQRAQTKQWCLDSILLSPPWAMSRSGGQGRFADDRHRFTLAAVFVSTPARPFKILKFVPLPL
jgi:hypothetical protein